MSLTHASTIYETPQFAQSDLPSQHGLSAFGLVLQLCRLNCLLPQDVTTALGLRLTYRHDWSHRLAHSPGAWSTLRHRISGVDPLVPSWDAQTWRPFTGSGYDYASAWTLRACPVCLTYGYHANLFQMSWIDECPWHGAKLRTTCRGCKRPLGSNIYRHAPLLLCPCGLDALSERRLLEHHHPFESCRNDYVDRYLRWAEIKRQSTILIGSVYPDSISENALKTLIRLPPRLQPWSHSSSATTYTNIHLRSLDQAPSWASQPHPRSLGDYVGYASHAPKASPVPKYFAQSIAGICASLGLPTPDQLPVFGRKRPRRASVEEEPSWELYPLVQSFPLFVSEDNELMLRPGFLSRETQTVLYQLCRNEERKRAMPRFSVKTARLVYERIFASILARGFVDAVAHCMRKHVPHHVPASIKSPTRWRPVVLIYSSRKRAAAKIAWCRSAGMQ